MNFNVEGETTKVTKVREYNEMVPITFRGKKIANVLLDPIDSFNLYPQIEGMPIGFLEIVVVCDYGIGEINRYLK